MTPQEIETKKDWEDTAHRLRLHHLSAQLLSLEIWLYDNSDFLYTSELQPSARLLPTHLSNGEGSHASLGFMFDMKIWEKSNIWMTKAQITEPILNFPLHHLQDSWKRTFVNNVPQAWCIYWISIALSSTFTSHLSHVLEKLWKLS